MKTGGLDWPSRFKKALGQWASENVKACYTYMIVFTDSPQATIT